MNNKVGCLIIHGIGGERFEIEPLNQYLIKEKIMTICPQLKGHTGRRKDLDGVSYQDWIESAEEGLIELTSKCEKVVLIGFSMGGLIAFHLALKYNIQGMVTLNTPIYYWDKKRIALNLLNDLKTRKFSSSKFYLKSAIALPLSALINFRLLLSKSKPLLKQIRTPFFVGQGLLDDSVNYRSAEYIYQKVLSEKKELRFYQNSNHLICLGEDQTAVCKDVLSFIQEISGL